MLGIHTYNHRKMCVNLTFYVMHAKVEVDVTSEDIVSKMSVLVKLLEMPISVC